MQFNNIYQLSLSILGLSAACGLCFSAVAQNRNLPVPSNVANTSDERLFKLGVALLQYSDDYDGKLPPMHTVAEVKSILGPYAHAEDFVQPESKQAYEPNPALSGRVHASLNGKKVVAFYEAKPRHDGSRAVLFLPQFDPKVIHYESNSGFVKNDIRRLNKTEWTGLKSTAAR